MGLSLRDVQNGRQKAMGEDKRPLEQEKKGIGFLKLENS